MKTVLTIILLFLTGSGIAGTLLHCNADLKCDGYANNCTNEKYFIAVEILPEKNKVLIGSNLINAEFQGPKLYFEYLDYSIVSMDKNSYEISLANQNEVRFGFCKKANAAW